MNRIIEEHGKQISVRREGSKEMRPEEVGDWQLVGGSAKSAFMYWLDNWSDIQSHLMTLYTVAMGNVLELGTRGAISTAALLAGVEKNGGKVWSVDYDPRCWAAFDGHPQWDFTCADSIDFDSISKKFPDGFVEIDVLFIDTDHKYERLKKELELWVPHVKPMGLVMMHDILSFPEMAKAAEEYAADHKLIYETRAGSNGMGIIRAPLS